MDYKEFIKTLRDEALFQRSRFGRGLIATELESAATAIETLLAERDAAIADIYHMGGCPNCKKNKGRSGRTGLPICEDMIEFPNGRCFEWRGPQKGDNNGDLPPV